ncbi:MAG: class I SAM-dependent RNA methyltransferase [Deltaproteobacteria bacterium]|nr:class I SAM-dependent RNA methyltransferase [Deltaproteobacteria bacterium]
MTEKIKIEKLVYEGKGMGLLDGRPVFVPYVMAGDTVEVEITRRHRQYSEAKLIAVLEPAPERVEPPCPYYGKCGGCQWQHLSYAAQLEWKQKILEETLLRVAKIENPKVLPTIPSPKELGWRSRFTFHGNDRGEIGFYEPESYRVVDIEKCLIAEDGVNEQLKRLKTEDQRPKTKRDYEINTSGKKGFTQVNPLQNENLKKLLKEWAEKVPHQTIVELFCGSGNLTEVLIPLAKNIVAVDSDRTAIDLATSSFFSIQFHCTDSVKFFAQYKPEAPLDLLVLDPPRDGAAGVVEGVMKTRPKNILYISCNPETLARDLKFLKDFANYELVQSQPIDMFPQSYHIESLSWIGPAKNRG